MLTTRTTKATIGARKRRGFASGEPIRLLHHFACTGGTLFSKCISTMPSVQLLSEVDPLSTALDKEDRNRFAPTDMVTLLRQSTRGATSGLIVELFLNNLQIVHARSCELRQRLVIRDHSHSHFCMGPRIPQRKTMRQIVSSKFASLSAITVRHPLDSFLSLEANGWESFSPFTLDEYCRRYLAFMRAYSGVPFIKYEDLVTSPYMVMRKLCSCLQIPYSESFPQSFGAVRLTGDSGRTGAAIEQRQRRTMSRVLRYELPRSRNYCRIKDLLQYAD
jgi:hypothetical protein